MWRVLSSNLLGGGPPLCHEKRSNLGQADFRGTEGFLAAFVVSLVGGYGLLVEYSSVGRGLDSWTVAKPCARLVTRGC